MHHPDLSYTRISDDARACELIDYGVTDQEISGITLPGVSYLDLGLRLPINDELKGVLQETLQAHDGAAALAPLLWSSRSVFGRLGLHMEVDHGSIEIGQSMLSFRIRVMGVGQSNGLNPEALLEKIKGEVVAGQNPRLGRIILLPEQKLTRSEVLEANRKRLLLPGGSTVNEDGTAVIPMAHVLHYTNPALFNGDGTALDRVLYTHKFALDQFQRPIPQEVGLQIPDTGGFFISHIGPSVGRYFGVVRGLDGMLHVSAQGLDALRTDGIESIRHLEILILDAIAARMGVPSIGLDFYPSSPEINTRAEWYFTCEQDLYDGIPLERVINVNDAIALFEGVGEDLAARIYKPNGTKEITTVDDSLIQTVLNKVQTNNWIPLKEGEEQSLKARLDDLSTDLRHKNFLITQVLPSEEEIEAAYAEGIGSFLVRDLAGMSVQTQTRLEDKGIKLLLLDDDLKLHIRYKSAWHQIEARPVQEI